MNEHNPPTEADVRASLWKRCERLQGQLDERTQQRDDLLAALQKVIDHVYTPAREREQIIDRAKKLIQVTREEMETE